jgi:hypothetical protein
VYKYKKRFISKRYTHKFKLMSESRGNWREGGGFLGWREREKVGGREVKVLRVEG